MIVTDKEQVIIETLRYLFSRTNKMSESSLIQWIQVDGLGVNSTENDARNIFNLLKDSNFIQQKGDKFYIAPKGITFLLDFENRSNQNKIMGKQTKILNNTNLIYLAIAWFSLVQLLILALTNETNNTLIIFLAVLSIIVFSIIGWCVRKAD